MKRTNYILVTLLVMIIAGILSGCPGNSKSESRYLEWNEGGAVLVKCGDVKITEAEVEEALLTMPEGRRDFFRENPQQKADFARRLLELKLASLKALEESCEEREDFKKQMDNLEALRKIQTKVALQQSLINKLVVDRIIITDKEAKDFYTQNYALWDKRSVSEIFLSLPPQPTDSQINEKRSLAEKIYTELSTGQISWNDAVKKYSDSSSVVIERHGDRGEVHRNSRKYGQDIIKAIFEMNKEGEILKPLSDKRGIFIIQLDDIMSFEEQKENIKNVIKSKRIRTESQELLDSLKTEPFEFFIEGYDPNKPSLMNPRKPSTKIR